MQVRLHLLWVQLPLWTEHLLGTLLQQWRNFASAENTLPHGRMSVAVTSRKERAKEVESGRPPSPDPKSPRWTEALQRVLCMR